MVCEYAMPIVPLDKVGAVVMESVDALTVRLSGFVAAAPLASETLTVKAEDPAAVGVPVIVVPFSESPAGRDPADTDHVYDPEPPVADSVCEYGALTIAGGSDVVATVSAGSFTVMLSGLVTVVAPSLT